MKTAQIVIVMTMILGLIGCKSYTANIIVKTEDGGENWLSTYTQTIVEYPIKIGDKIQFTLYTNQGESIIDPTGSLNTPTGKANGSLNEISEQLPVYEVLEDGECFFPLIGKLKVDGFKTSQLDSLLAIEYDSFYIGVYVKSKVINKKIVILGATGGQIIPYNPTLNLLEVLAIYGGLDNNSKGYNIRVIRGDLQNPQVKVVNLRTIQDMKSTIVKLQPDDIIYIEPVRRPAAEGIRDNIYILNIVQVLVTLTVLFTTLTR